MCLSCLILSGGCPILRIGLRLYFLTIPLFAWVISVYALLAVCPIYLYAVHGYEDLTWLAQECEEFKVLTATLASQEGHQQFHAVNPLHIFHSSSGMSSASVAVTVMTDTANSGHQRVDDNEEQHDR